MILFKFESCIFFLFNSILHDCFYSSEPEIIQTEQWLRPCKRLPLRKRVSVPSNEYFCSAEEYTESSLLEPNNCETDDQLFTESSVELSFYDYKHTKARLEQTLISLSETPRSNEEKAGTDIQYLCVMSMEILALTSRGMPVPDPKCDEILGIFYTVFTDVCCQNETDCVNGVLLNMDEAVIAENDSYTFVTSENDLFCSFAKIIQRYDPDIVIGYNTTRYSWGYLIERSLVLGRNLLSEISRYHIDINHYYRPGEQSRIKWVKELDTTPKGRILVNIWRIIRSEVSLRNYTLSNVVNKLLNRRFPQYSFPTLTEWILSNRKDLICLVLHHLQLSCQLNMIVLLRLDFFTKTSEMARLYGIQFNDVFTRGSQFRVESMLLRLAHQQNYVAPSISTLQREMMCSPETLPLTMEPESGYYNDPVIVLDFQSLYPSIIIAYNYCFSTCLGKLLHVTNIDLINKVIEFGGLEYNCPLDDIISMHKKRELHISPTGVIFCKKSVRKGLMPLMLEEILDTRVMVKKAVKKYKDNRLLARTLDARQIALKMVANVTYGYSAANFSGRMPCVEVADAIVSKGRETLERAIHLVNSGNYGNSRVVYGDTDSMFVVCPEATRIEAFDIGRRIADDVTNANPKPVKLKMEKVMHPLILESKKRYVGMSYESATDSEGVFDSKGIETVRRDSCPLVSRILEKVLRLLFSNNVNQMMRYLDIQLSNLSQLALSEFIFSREYRKSYAQSAVVASKLIAEKRKAISLRYEPEVGERVPFVIVSGEPNSTLISCVREPQEFISDRRMTLNFEYYVNRQVLPSLQRALDYVFLKIEWRCPTIVGCYKCRALGTRLWCTKCITDPKALVLALTNYYQEKRLLAKLNNICPLRSISIDYSKCINMACIVKQKRIFLGRSVTADAVKTHALTDKETFLNFE
ncbi:unnamed protein product [Thelazia callipaeda]|uniref:DNA polymerase n=1 Tax=Thelazia callipaeda TaxID=103827 RepID=A0A0N5CPQ6_THECL|nr:unnamed protein product [Thelazia callipaeda]